MPDEPVGGGVAPVLCEEYQPEKDEMHRCAYDNGFCPFKGDPNRCGERD